MMRGEEARRLLMAFCEHIGLRPQDERGQTVEEFREEVVSEFERATTPEFAGFSDDELKGTARDRFDVLVDGVPVTHERAVELKLAVHEISFGFDEARGLPGAWAHELVERLRAQGVEPEIPAASAPARIGELPERPADEEA